MKHIRTLYDWKKIKDFENYEINQFGQIRNCKTGCILKPQKDKYGYLCVGLYKSSKVKKFFKIHRLVAAAAKESGVSLSTISHHCNNEVKNPKWQFYFEGGEQ